MRNTVESTRFYTANYSNTEHNFVIQNLPQQSQVSEEWLSVFYVLKNLFMRGAPTEMSRRLKNQLVHPKEELKRCYFISAQPSEWRNTIKGDSINNYYPAREFYEKIPDLFEEWGFIQQLFLPETPFNKIIKDEDNQFVNQNVDFYLPQAKLVIEIDGQSHETNESELYNDRRRDEALIKNNINIIRITTKELRDNNYHDKIYKIKEVLQKSSSILNGYKEFYLNKKNKYKEPTTKFQLDASAICRFQILLIELLIYKNIQITGKQWSFNILIHEPYLEGFAELAIDDFLDWLENILRLNNTPFIRPKYEVFYINSWDTQKKENAIAIDFSLLKRYTDEHLYKLDTIYVRTDYFDATECNYFRVSTTKPISYPIHNDNPTQLNSLRYFIQNIFNKEDFRDGQIPIIANALRRVDAVGLLPTGGGKSLCYQLAVLLQPSISFVVSPIKSLMYDQKENLDSVGITNINFISSDLDAEEKNQVMNDFGIGKYFFILISPERFQIQKFRASLQEVQANKSISYAVIDEVHCLSEWGHDFRTSYLILPSTIKKICIDAKFIGLTATASANVAKDIRLSFGIKDEHVTTIQDYSRNELDFEVIKINNDDPKKGIQKREILKNTINKYLNPQIKNFDNNEAALIFTPYVNGDFGCYQVSRDIQNLFSSKVEWYSGECPTTKIYEGGKVKGKKPIMSEKEFDNYKITVQKNFKDDKFPIMVATKAFGMGIDKQNISYTFHYGIPSSIEALYQEAGRAGRWNKQKKENQEKKAYCKVLFSPENIPTSLLTEIFGLKTPIERINQIRADVSKTGKDLFRILFLFSSGVKELKEDYIITKFVIETYGKRNQWVTINKNEAVKSYDFFKIKYNINSHIGDFEIEKALYRLFILGFVNDWTKDFINKYNVNFSNWDDTTALSAISKYISKYGSSINVEKEITNLEHNAIVNTFQDKIIWFILIWTYENITYARRQSLKNLYELCLNFKDSRSFKNVLDNYFKVTEITYTLQHIGENPRLYKKWFEVLLPEIKILPNHKLEELKNGLSRFLESYRQNMGLNFISGIVRLLLNDYENTDGRLRLEDSFIQLKSNESIYINDVFSEVFNLMKLFNSNQIYQISFTILKIFPERKSELVDRFNLVYLLEDEVKIRIERIQSINKIIYESFTKI
ncbi:DEAD/DEAH box helicase [Runella sp. CRIBMP]|uniref:DEAD/DEAH box helicase n=1 Tax=Runella sp. CRIBMP TaxID=2683261 RepID=UPI001412FB02|nr:DEAD/DEAH box helicase [Runella sp. CRIBMP]NBB19322.1 DEAD/DEAH box helicase [Runella sp. CRIBMP]